MGRSVVVGLVALTLTGCPKGKGPGSAGGGTVAVGNRTPIQCTRIRKEERVEGAETFEPGGCLASVRFHLSPSGVRDVQVPNFRDATRAESSERVTEGRVTSRTIMLKDPAGEQLWAVDLPEDELPWDAGACARSEDPSRFDMNQWRLMVIRVLTRDAHGTARPITEVQDDTLSVKLKGSGADWIRPALVPSRSHPGVWAAAWCADTSGRLDVELDVRGAYQLEVDAFTMTDTSKDTYTMLEYIVEPIAGDHAL